MPANPNKERTREWYQETIEVRRAYANAWNAANREKVNAQRKANYDTARNTEKMRRYRAKNAEKYKAYTKEWRLKNKEKHAQYTKNWREANPEEAMKSSIRYSVKEKLGCQPPKEFIDAMLAVRKLNKVIKEKTK